MTSEPLLLPLGDDAPDIAPSAWVAPGASVIGRATLHEGASVFYGAVVRADTDAITLGERSNLQDNVSVHCDTGAPTSIGTGVSVGHNAVLHGCTIEDDVLIGMSATVLNRAVIGRGSLVAAGTVVLEDTVVPPGSLVAGVPGKVRRELTEAEQEKIRANAAHYVELSAQHREAWAAQAR
ncbi:gamma carbonic anhydrase family protein [Frondihabitans australicus]|uniref:Carbonic anhydrase/acetyltransferase-like protein (Isoleucine patch superfamily) n=1 Tax=Frondihabitans australicus TaxID=386892 RepID=A0A495ICG2_9MICO|nr:gamma carbonic anhydrase family protein [Frondihabitans australicus]RKR73609.1 carbonic anhydrase/acetyltransferase-like protein (isoleucine patch superfamily) [Frondihabitans australicus]